ncbi:MAG: hypothetical protein ACTSRS_04570 [Candidatus Helarchaeota archaeon]
MLDNLYIFHSSGKLLFSKNWREEGIQEDPVLISGFLSAIWMFAKKIGSKGVRSIQTETNLLVGVSSPTYDLLFVLVANRNADASACTHLLKRIRQSFIIKHSELLKTPDLAVSTDRFEDWNLNLEKLIEEIDVAPVESVMKRLMQNLVDGTKDDPHPRKSK